MSEINLPAIYFHLVICHQLMISLLPWQQELVSLYMNFFIIQVKHNILWVHVRWEYFYCSVVIYCILSSWFTVYSAKVYETTFYCFKPFPLRCTGKWECSSEHLHRGGGNVCFWACSFTIGWNADRRILEWTTVAEEGARWGRGQ